MFLIKWRRRMVTDACRRIFPVQIGISRYPTVKAANWQIAIWSKIFQFNSYYVEPANG